jgi:RNA polymerase sigma-70 factor (ECF subfamily)
MTTYETNTMEFETEEIEGTVTETTQTQLVRAAQQGDREAFGRLFEQFQRVVCAIAFRRLGNHAEAQEVCQEVFIQAMRKIGQLRDPRCFAGWLRSMASRMSLNRAIRGRQMQSVPETYEVPSTADVTPLGGMLEEESRAQVHTGLNRLSTLDRATLVAFYFDGRSLNEMSDEFRTPVGTIKRRLHVARKRLARALSAAML